MNDRDIRLRGQSNPRPGAGRSVSGQVVRLDRDWTYLLLLSREICILVEVEIGAFRTCASRTSVSNRPTQSHL